MEQRDTFNAVAGFYAQARPAYPPALFDDLAELGALSPSSQVLEVGCGAGQATRELALRAASVTALDPGPDLIAEARAAAAGAGATFSVCRFEEFEAADASFDLVASAQAWHWIAPDIAFPKAARLLRDNGWLAVFGHAQLPPAGKVAAEFERAFDEFAPGVWGSPHPTTAYLPSGPWRELFGACGLFEPVLHRGYAWTWEISSDLLGRFLRTDSTYHFLAEPRRFALFDRMTAAVAEDGGVYRAPWETHLYAARKRRGASSPRPR